MVYAYSHVRVSFGGALFATEQWSCTINMGGSGGHADGPLSVAELALAKTAVQQWFQRATSHIHNQAKLGWIKGNEIGVNGKYEDPFGAVEDIYSPILVGPEASPNAPSDALCMSWTTARARGPGAHGRIYTPIAFPTYDVNGLITTAKAIECQGSAKTLLDLLNDIRPGLRVIVASQGGVGTPPANVPVTGVRVGRVMDTQRRRRASISEAYVPTVALEPV